MGAAVSWRRTASVAIAFLFLVCLAVSLAACGGDGAEDEEPTPAAGKIAFVSDRDGALEIYVMNADGSDLARLTDNSADDSSFAWSTDGTRIAFASNRDGNYEIYVMNADGSGQTNLTDNPAVDGGPAWSP